MALLVCRCCEAILVRRSARRLLICQPRDLHVAIDVLQPLLAGVGRDSSQFEEAGIRRACRLSSLNSVVVDVGGQAPASTNPATEPAVATATRTGTHTSPLPPIGRGPTCQRSSCCCMSKESGNPCPTALGRTMPTVWGSSIGRVPVPSQSAAAPHRWQNWRPTPTQVEPAACGGFSEPSSSSRPATLACATHRRFTFTARQVHRLRRTAASAFAPVPHRWAIRRLGKRSEGQGGARGRPA